MAEAKAEIQKTGLFTSFQGSRDYLHLESGFPFSGCLDHKAHSLANWLVGNPLSHPCLEISIIGPKIQFFESAYIAITGADISPSINDQAVVNNETLRVEPGDVLKFGRLKSGCRAYLAIQNLLCTAKDKGKRIVGNHALDFDLPQKELHRIWNEEPVDSQGIPIIRAIKGPEFDWIMDGKGFQTPWKVSAESNRMAYRLKGSEKIILNKRQLISSGIIPGTVQCNFDGQLMLLLNDAQTTGGYPRILKVVEADLDKLAQLKPGDFLTFHLVSHSTAQKLLSDYQSFFELLRNQS